MNYRKMQGYKIKVMTADGEATYYVTCYPDKLDDRVKAILDDDNATLVCKPEKYTRKIS